MFDFNGCIDVTFERLARLVDTVDTKYTRFSNIASENIICDSDIFNGHQLIDCELLALVFNKYMTAANKMNTSLLELIDLDVRDCSAENIYRVGHIRRKDLAIL
ncbi:hypothetical protein G5I_13866 [Acromyrmex echinatior]|uniref:Uncharacterized protein n=1 Tax=Acromyrmex echinatior TaxID=103372 RepID=F4X662_ACREC|nr:hypothetical protein G5I_13866 [Acromyrmex echinatior]